MHEIRMLCVKMCNNNRIVLNEHVELTGVNTLKDHELASYIDSKRHIIIHIDLAILYYSFFCLYADISLTVINQIL